MKHIAPSSLLQNTVGVELVGVGGNGSQMLTGLARVHLMLKALGHPGLRVVAWDPDVVTRANIGRQLFSESDIGQNKATVLVNRLNCFFGLDWGAVPRRYELPGNRVDLIISCVDSAAARRAIADMMPYSHSVYWLDLGNRRMDGQVVLGQAGKGLTVKIMPSGYFVTGDRSNAVEILRLPTVVEVFPELMDTTVPEDDTPSCSLLEALDKQGLFVNQHVSTWALTLLEKLFRNGGLDHHGYFINLETGCVNPLPVPDMPISKNSRKEANRRARA